MFKVISFDLDRTLIFHAKGAKHEQVVAMLAAQGYPTTVEAYQAATHLAREFYDVLGYRYANDPAALRTKYVQLALELIGCADQQVIDGVAAFYRAYDQDAASFFTPPEAITLLDALRRRGLQLVAISSNLFAAQRLRHCGLEGRFAHVLTPTLGYPKTELYRLLLERTGAPAGAVRHIGDDPILDVLAPQSFGIDAILFDPDSKYAALTWPAIVRSYAEMQAIMIGDG
jgi:FMN phosphatase YigB (HAD superfamily)